MVEYSFPLNRAGVGKSNGRKHVSKVSEFREPGTSVGITIKEELETFVHVHYTELDHNWPTIYFVATASAVTVSEALENLHD